MQIGGMCSTFESAMGPESLRSLAEIQRKEAPESIETEMEDILTIGQYNDDDEWEDVPDHETTSTISYAIWDILQDRVQYRSRRDKRTWQQRVRNLDANWWPLMPQVIQVYLRWKHGSAIHTTPTAAPREGPVLLHKPSPVTQASAPPDEDPPVFECIICLNGNNSPKRMAPTGGRANGDLRVFNSDYILPRAFVNQFPHEVKSRQRQKKPDVPDAKSTAAQEELPPEEAQLGAESMEGDPTDGVPDGINPCASNWKAATTESNKRMWGIFDETGIFACCCRHGLILWFVDMVRSGELAEYPIAIIKKILMLMPERVLIGYNIGCTFDETISRSSIGLEFKMSGSRFCVNMFYGLEDLETLKRVFGDSNELAPVMWYCSPYRQHMFCHLFFRQRDAEKYANLSLMLDNNYVQALEIVNSQTPVLEEPGNSQYNDIIKYISERKYQRALGKLQCLVIQRLFKLNKLNISRTGYKARTYIAKSLQRRCQAIHNAVNAYNAAARELSPPREVLDWSKVSHYAFLEEFTLLCDTKNDIREKPWAKPVVHEAMRLANHIARSVMHQK
ncbi:hypothetical protein BV20DRAFT_1051440 [Pilatotrama ljubarskyi]|nr:hypothetical protein BV20DRAFT_1051440 [Pilatotrama ljubarskyi]